MRSRADLADAPQPDEHLVMLHLGRQHTGPPFYRFHAQEAKFEVPFVAPPFSTSPDHGRAVPSVFKHSLWTDHTIMATSARYAMGLRTEKAVFDPPTAPSDAMNQRALADSAVQAKYEVKGRVSWEGTKVEGEFVKEQYAGEQGTLRTSEMWWFGEYAAGTLCKVRLPSTLPPSSSRSANGWLTADAPSVPLHAQPPSRALQVHNPAAPPLPRPRARPPARRSQARPGAARQLPR
ncbi:hypothetical protein CALCODRAFT_36367 [Calocera cornea HHB12733]|uniref:Uncharacterized protein n=1 Tax=Calocera cornea HHB12733 TaxID=1353952 RepID=A0A165DZQ0_9BASI|nr:hypothetical protein CALCODRAFT_36367 [Calocera cornea HHB12733]